MTKRQMEKTNKRSKRKAGHRKMKIKNKEILCVCVIKCDLMQQSLFIPTRVSRRGQTKKERKKERKNY